MSAPNNSSKPTRQAKSGAMLCKELLGSLSMGTGPDGMDTYLNMEQQMLMSMMNKAKAGNAAALNAIRKWQCSKAPDIAETEETEEWEINYSLLNMEELDFMEATFAKAMIKKEKKNTEQ
jgi:hypothetical protein